MPRCKNCKEKFEPVRFNQKYCLESECVKVWVQVEKEKKWKKDKARIKKELMTVQDYIKVAQQVFNKWIRERDKGQPCISCENPTPKKVNAGHFYSANNHWNVRFNEDNVHLQCEYCNSFLSGNLIPYRANLIKKIGQERFETLESIANETRKFTIEELKEIIKKYKI